MHIWLWLCILVEFCRIWIASSLLVFFMQCKLVYKSIICSIRFFDFNFQGAIGEWRFLDFYSVQFLQVKVCQVFICFVLSFFNFHRRGQQQQVSNSDGIGGDVALVLFWFSILHRNVFWRYNEDITYIKERKCYYSYFFDPWWANNLFLWCLDICSGFN